jgi:hypothetical protein
MKNLARLALFFSVFFIIVFAASALLNFLALWIDAAKTVPVRQGMSGDFIASGAKALPAALYITILLCLSYTARRQMPVSLSIIAIFVLSAVFTLGFTLGIERLRDVNLAPPAFSTIEGEPGLILSRSSTSIVLLKESTVNGGPRVVAISGQSLLYQETPVGPNNSALSLPSLPFRTDKPWFMTSLLLDFNLVSREFEERLGNSLLSFCIYAGSLIFFLAGLRFLLELSQWPLANLFVGAVAFRGILALEIFLDTPEMAAFLNSYLNNRLPGPLLAPLVFCALGVLVILYTLLAHLARGKGREDA